MGEEEEIEKGEREGEANQEEKDEQGGEMEMDEIFERCKIILREIYLAPPVEEHLL